MSTQIFKKLSECRTCLNAGHSGQKIGFLKTDKVKLDGKPVWDLRNEDRSPHIHKTEQTNRMENPAKQAQTADLDVKEKHHLTEVINELISAIKVLTVAINNRPVSK